MSGERGFLPADARHTRQPKCYGRLLRRPSHDGASDGDGRESRADPEEPGPISRNKEVCQFSEEHEIVGKSLTAENPISASATDVGETCGFIGPDLSWV